MSLKLAEYVKKRNSVAMGQPNSLRNNLTRSLGASNFANFWIYWNPIFGFYLGNFIFKPLKKFLPELLALIVTFVFCGLIHDLVTTLVRGSASLFFTLWFFFMSFFVVFSKITTYNLSRQNWRVRTVANLAIIVTCFFLTKKILSVLKTV